MNTNTSFTFQQGKNTYKVVAEQALFVEGQYKIYFETFTITLKGKIVNAHATQYGQSIEKGLKFDMQDIK